MKIHSDGDLSKIEQLFHNLEQNKNQNQFIRLQFKLNGYKEKNCQNKVIIETHLLDGQYSQTAILTGKAADLIKQYINEQFINVNCMIIQLIKWKVVYFEKHKNHMIVIYEFQYITSQDGENQCIQFNLDQNSSSGQKKVRLVIKKSNDNTNNQQQNTNSIKKVKIENSSFMKDSFILDENLLNISLLDNPANHLQINQFNNYQQQQQQQQQVQVQQELTKISTMYPNMKQWVLEGRIIFKSEQLDFRCKKTETISRYFKILILDCEQEMIVGLFFEKALSKFFTVLQQEKVYLFKNGCIGQDKSNGTKKITFNEYSIIQESLNFAIPSAPQLNFSTLQEIENLQHNSFVDVVAVIQEIKQDSDSCKSFIVFDQTSRLSVKLWGIQYSNINLQKGEIMVFKGLKFQNTNFKSLNSDNQTMIIQNHDLNEVKYLKNWLAGKNIDTVMRPNQDNSSINLQQLDEFVFKLLNEGKTQQTSINYIFGYIIEIHEHNNMYPSCPNIRCKSKMEEVPCRKTYRCKKCQIENDKPKFSFVLKVTIMDEYSNIQAVIFDEVAVKLLGITADQLRLMNLEDQRNIFLSKAYQQKKMKLQIQLQDYNGQIKPKYNIQEILDIDYKVLASQAFEMFDELDNLLNLSLIL